MYYHVHVVSECELFNLLFGTHTISHLNKKCKKKLYKEGRKTDEPKTFTADDMQLIDFDALSEARRDELKADGCLFELYCITKELEAADRAYEVITELSEILTRRGITRTLFDKSQVAKPSAYYSGVFREVLERGRTT